LKVTALTLKNQFGAGANYKKVRYNYAYRALKETEQKALKKSKTAIIDKYAIIAYLAINMT